MAEIGDTPRKKRPGAAVDRVIDMIVGRISSGELGPGEQLRQEDLAETLGVSRVPVREALHALAEQRVLVHLKHRGFFVAKRSPAELAQLARLLEIIENEVLETIEWPDAEVLGQLRALNGRMLAIAGDYDTTETFALNRQFHFTIFNLSQLKIMIDELERLWRLAQPFVVAEMMTSDARIQRTEEHERIIEQLTRRDRQALLEVMMQHRRRSGRRTATQGNAQGRQIPDPGAPLLGTGG
jgi:DNA-binding GntR family transcriptional regulator